MLTSFFFILTKKEKGCNKPFVELGERSSVITSASVIMFCVRAIKKIFSAVLRMTSNSYENEILADARTKLANADKIFGFASDEIKSTHRRGDFIQRGWISSSKTISPTRQGGFS